MSSTANRMAKAVHQYMVKSSAGVFRARFVVPLYDWPSMLEDDDDNVYDSVSTTVDDLAGRTRLSAGVFVTEVSGPPTQDRMLCVTARTAKGFVNVLHRLLCGFAGDAEDVSTRLLVSRADFESATASNGRGGLESAVNELRRVAYVWIDEGFEQFTAYPLAGETALRIVGRPSSVVHCVCLVNEMLCESALLEAVDQQSPYESEDWLRCVNFRPDPDEWNAIFQRVTEQYEPPSPLETGSYPWPESEPRPTSPYWGLFDYDTDNSHSSRNSPTKTRAYRTAVETRPSTPTEAGAYRTSVDTRPSTPTETGADRTSVETRPGTPTEAGAERIAVDTRPTTPTETGADRTAVDTRPTTPTCSVSRQPVNRNRSPRFAAAVANRPTTPFRRFSGRRRVVRKQVSPSHVTTNAATATTTTAAAVTPRTATSFQNVSNRHTNQTQSSRHAAASTKPTASTWSVSDRLGNRNQSQRHATAAAAATRPTASTWSVSDRLVNRNPSSRHAAATTTTVTTRPAATSVRSVSDRLAKRKPSQHLAAATNTTVTTGPVTSARSVSDRPVNRNPSSRVTAATATPVRSVSDRLIVNRKQSPSTTKATATTSTTDRNVRPIRSVSDRLIVNRKQSPSTTKATATTDRNGPPIRSVSDRLIVNRKQSTSSVTANATAAATTAAATDRNATPYLSASDQADISRQLSSLRVTTKANTAINRHTTCVRGVSDRLVNRNPSSRVPDNDTTADTSIDSITSVDSTTSPTSTTADQSSDISIGEFGDSSQSDLT